MSKVHSISRPKSCTVYFFQIGEDGPIKIGRTVCDPMKRLSGIQANTPHEVRLLAIIANVGHAFEAELHERFSHLHIRGEWFEPSGELLGFIASDATPWKGGSERPDRGKYYPGRVKFEVRSRMTDEEIRRSRATEMARMKQEGVAVKDIARKYRLSVGYVYQEMRAIRSDNGQSGGEGHLTF
jgi:hypothetical protein